jgi:DHA1 family tetracycline resistance protein-like MFS transporter
VGVLAYALVPLSWMIFPAIAIGSLGGIANPAMQSVMSQQAGPSAQGELQGVNACIASVAAVISPVFMTQLFKEFAATDAPVYLPGAPYIVAAVLVFCCVLITLRSVPATASRTSPP